MVSSYRKGLKRALVYYLMGIILTLILHQIIGWENKAVMPRSTLMIILLVMVGLPWSLLNALGLGCPVRKFQNSAELVIHSAAFFVAAVLIYYFR